MGYVDELLIDLEHQLSNVLSAIALGDENQARFSAHRLATDANRLIRTYDKIGQYLFTCPLMGRHFSPLEVKWLKENGYVPGAASVKSREIERFVEMCVNEKSKIR